MKYFAVLKDSFREALDSKVLYVLLALSTIVILLVATISFRPLPAEKTMEQFFFTGQGAPLTIVLNVHKADQTQAEKMDAKRRNRIDERLFQFSLRKVELQSGEPDAPESEYALTISYRPFPPGMRPPGHPDDLESELNTVRAIFQEAEEFGYLHVKSAELVEDSKKDGEPKLFRVVLQGTSQMVRIWATDITIFGKIPVEAPHPRSPSLGFKLYFLASVVNFFGELTALLVGVIITSFFIPNMLRKGTVDLLLVKPIHRWLLLLYKYIGGLTFVFVNIAYAIGGIWLVIGLRTGLWANGMLLLIFTVTFFFAILYAISCFIGVLTRSTVTAIMLTIAAWVVFFGVGRGHEEFDNQYLVEKERAKKGNPLPEAERWGNNEYGQGFRAIHAFMPRTRDLSLINDIIVYTAFMTGDPGDMEKFDNSNRSWTESTLVSCVWIAIFLGIACLRFTYKDY